MIRPDLLWLAPLAFVAAAAAAPAAAGTTLPAVVEFNRHIRPIMSNTCFKCHGPDMKNNKSTLRLDLRDVAFASHRNAKGRVFTPLVPGKPEQSEVWKRISASDPAERMPPTDSLHQLTAHDRALFKKWIEQGAKYQPHWAYIVPTKVDLPAKSAHPIDAFIRAELEARSIQPSVEADRRTSIRRLSLDLLGLPPTPAEVTAFLADQRPDAYERLVDRLLASEHFGERMAVPWLDLVRFADTVGYHGDQRQNIFPYRDYVIDAFNRNKPFDRFVREQIAGDLLPDAAEEQRIASGFNRLNMMTREGGAQPKEYLAKYSADRVRAVSTAFLGSTMACAECHDHKFDPFATKDFYSMAAYFADVKQYGVYTDYRYTPEPELAGFNNEYPFPPEIEVTSEPLQRRLERLRTRFDQQISTAAKSMVAEPARWRAIAQWAKDAASALRANPEGWTVPAIANVKTNANTLARHLSDGSLLFTRAESTEGAATMPVSPKDVVPHVITFGPTPGSVSSVRLEALPDEAHGGLVGRDKKEVFTALVRLAVIRAGATIPQPLEIADGYPDGETQSYANVYRMVTIRGNWTSARNRARQRQFLDFLLKQPVTLAAGDRLVATLSSADVGRVRCSISPLGGRLPHEKLREGELKAFQTDAPTREQRELIAARYILSTGAGERGRFERVLDDLREIAECRNGKAFTMVTVAMPPLVTRVLPRGNWQDESGEVVSPAPPRFLAKGSAASSSARPGVAAAGAVGSVMARPVASAMGARPRQNRLDLANWIAARDNPLTARAFVNRLWKQFFGTGLSAVLDDLGMQGEYPSHPELLDWLAVDFVESGWDVKAMVRRMVTSATYRQSSKFRPELREVDPQNRLLARQSARRLEAEFVRDNALAAVGLLNPELGGPSATPYQPEGYYAALNFPTRRYVEERDERQYRRGVYMHWQRQFLHPMLANFDAPSREECTAARTLSSTPQQALTLLNDPTFVEAARALAEHALTLETGADFARRLEDAFLRLLARTPSAREVSALQTHYEQQLQYYREHPADADKLATVGLKPLNAGVGRVELAAWTSVARILINLNETIVIY